jgi:putative ABC transport system permease protein
MTTMNRVRRRLDALLRRDRFEREMDDEMRFHLEMEVEDRVRGGMSREEAERTAMRDFGAVDRFKDEVRDASGVGWLEEFRQDVRFSLRTLRKNPAFAALAVLTLALGIGANTAVFSVVNSTLLQPLPYPEPDRLVTVWELNERGQEISVAGPNFQDWRDLSGSFEAIAAYVNPEFSGLSTVLGADGAVRTRAHGVTREFFAVLRVQPSLGRAFTAEETRPGGPAAALVSHSFWQSHLSADPGVLGRGLDVMGETHEIVGVMPPGFHYPGGTEIWTSLDRGGLGGSRTSHNWLAIGRLRDGVTLDAARREMDRLMDALRAQHGTEMSAVGTRLTRLQDELVGELRRPLLLLLGAAALVLLIACTNLASALLARGAAREREVAVRASLGAGRLRLVRQLLTESMVLAGLGALAGLAVAALALRALLSLAPAGLAPLAQAQLDGWALAFALVVAVITALLFGLLPALRLSEAELAGTLRAGTRGSTGGSRRAWGVLVGSQVALAFLLLIGSGLLIRSFREVLAVDTGFDAARVLTVEISLPGSRYASDPAIAAVHQRVLTELGRLPGVEAAGIIQHLPFGGQSYSGGFEIEGRGPGEAYASYRVAGGDYFPAMGIPLVRGRLFEPGDDAGAGDVAVINQALAERVWPGEDPVGRRIRNLANDSWIYPDRWITIVGVVGNVRHGGLLAGWPGEVYVHYLQRPARIQEAVVTLRASVPPATLIGPARERIRAVDPDVPAEFATMGARVSGTVADRRFTMLTLGAFALVALLLSAVGIYGVVSHAVARRTREIGIRLALGAEPRAVRALVQRNAMRTAAAGAVLGVLGALLLTRMLRGLLYGVSPTDPLTFGAVVLVLGAVAWLASYLPARRTTRIDPMITMRAE